LAMCRRGALMNAGASNAINPPASEREEAEERRHSIFGPWSASPSRRPPMKLSLRPCPVALTSRMSAPRTA